MGSKFEKGAKAISPAYQLSKALKSPKVPGAEATDVSGDIQKYVSGMSKALPQILEKEQEFRPKFQGLNLGDIQSFLGGVDGRQGIFGLSGEAAQQAGMGLGEARAAELEQMASQTGLVREMMQSLSPEQAGVVQGFDEEAQRAYTASQRISPEEQRGYQQSAREAASAAGRIGGNAAIASEVMGREDVFARKRAEAAQSGQRAYDAAQGFYTQPGLGLLGSTPLSYQQGQQFINTGLGAIGAGTPQLFDTSVGLNIGAADRSNQLAAQQANAQAKAANRSGIMSAIGSIGSAALMASDKRLKTDISKVGKTNKGLPIYTYKYKGNNTTQMGVMAQDVEKKTPKAVKEVGGFKAVNYKLIK
jgi:hypothetical protein